MRTDARVVKGMVLRSIGRESARVRTSFCPYIFTSQDVKIIYLKGMYITIKMYIITINNNYAYHFENFQEVVPFVKQEIRKHLRKNSSSHTASYDEWFFTDDVTIYECNTEEIDNTYRNEEENLDVYGIRLFERQKNVIFYYENTVKVIHVTYIPRFEPSKFIDLPTEESDDNNENESEEEEESEEETDDIEDEDETETESEDEEENNENTEEPRERTESEKNIEKEEGEFTTIN